MAQHTEAAKRGIKAVLGLYRSILRLHREKLPPGPMRDLGDSYTRAEFSAHLKSAKTTKEQWLQFMGQWQGYRAMLSGTGPQDSELAHVAENLTSYLSPEQQLRMDALKKEAGELGKGIVSRGQEQQPEEGEGTPKPLQ